MGLGGDGDEEGAAQHRVRDAPLREPGGEAFVRRCAELAVVVTIVHECQHRLEQLLEMLEVDDHLGAQL